MKRIVLILFLFLESCNLPTLNRFLFDSQLIYNLIKGSSLNQNLESVEIIFNPPTNSILVYDGRVEISAKPSGVMIYYTTDGITPTNTSTQYNSPIAPNIEFPGKTIKAIAIGQNGQTSKIFEARYFFPILKSGQNTCYNLVSNNNEPCTIGSHNGQDGLLQSGYTRSYNSLQAPIGYPSDLITVDTILGQVWTACNLGSSGISCVNPYTPYNWNDAKLACTALNAGSGYAGRTNWRLPKRIELLNLLIMDSAQADLVNFPSTFLTGYYWVDDSYPTNVAYGSMIGFVNWALSGGMNSGTRPIRCISGDPKINSLSDLGNGTVLDNLYGLLWTKCLDGEDPINCSGVANSHTYPQALNYCNSKTLDGRIWRLPNAYELETLVDLTAPSAPYIKSANIFSLGLGVGKLNSSTTYPSNTSDFFRLDTITGSISGFGVLKNNPSYSFCVTNY